MRLNLSDASPAATPVGKLDRLIDWGPVDFQCQSFDLNPSPLIYRHRLLI